MTLMSTVSAQDVSLKPAPRRGYLYGPALDFILLGGGSILVLALVPFLWADYADTAFVSTLMLYIANVINHPHFAHSYQLFYRNFRGRAFGDHFPAALRRRYIFAALVAPVLLIGFFAYCILAGDVQVLGYGANLMFFLVGWHYVKQGYGMLMVDSVIKRNFFSERDKRVLLWNSYVVWITSWVLYNNVFHEKSYWGIGYYTFNFPSWLLGALIASLVVSSAITIPVIVRKWRQGGAFPLSGVAAYFISLYIWLLVTHPAMLLIIPAFHSLQYLAIVWKCRLGMESDPSLKRSFLGSSGVRLRFSMFLIVGFILGYLGFWGVPQWLDATIEYDRSLFGGSLFLFLFWIFINVHHYFLDNVMWRKDNPDTKKYLFGAT